MTIIAAAMMPPALMISLPIAFAAMPCFIDIFACHTPRFVDITLFRHFSCFFFFRYAGVTLTLLPLMPRFRR